MIRRLLPIVIGITLVGRVQAQVVDSLLPIEEEVRRFRLDLGAPPAQLTGGAASPAALIRQFAIALERRDSAALKAMMLSKAEFGYFYFPWSEYATPPYRQKPALVWFRLAMVSERGIGRALARDGGRPLEIVGHRCGSPVVARGDLRLHQDCRLRLRRDGAIVERRLFGSIVERRGRFKFLSYATDY